MRPCNWPALLDQHVERARQTPFAWGRHDCVTFVCVWHQAMTGRDIYAPWRGRYDSETAAFRFMLDIGCRDMEALGRHLFGEPIGNKALIARGDIVIAEGALGICTGALGAFLSAEGFEFRRHADFALGWSV